ncbi:lipoate--protein ligase family protein [Candidatus Thermokryptus mobilis]|nr:lipoate--protein ligase family protein [Candidatus Thermokryptus mobilis]
MKFDEFLVDLFSKGEIPPVLRVYGWKPYAISIGYNQNIEIFDIEKIKSFGFDIVRRPTGGRAILHAEELTYSVVMNSKGKSVIEIYNLISEAIVSGLNLLGVEVELEISMPDFVKSYKDYRSIPCFAITSKYEVKYKGRKLVGSAQRRYGDVVLQHGSILIGDFHKKLPEFLKTDKVEIIEEIKGEIENKTICLNEILGRDVSFDEVADVLRSGFEMRFGAKFDKKDFLSI